MNPAYNSVNFYEILQVPASATLEEIKKARNLRAREHHTDKIAGDGERMKAINEAFRVLSNPELRKEFDLNLDDDDFAATEAAGFLNVGRKLSDEYLAKMDFWKLQGMQGVKVKFHNFNETEASWHGFPEKPSTVAYENFSGCQRPHFPPRQEWNLTPERQAAIKRTLHKVFPNQVAFKPLQLLDKQFWTSAYWSMAAASPSTKKDEINYREEKRLMGCLIHSGVAKLVNLATAQQNMHNVKAELFSHYAEVEGSLLFASKRYPPHMQVKLAPDSLGHAFNFTLYHTVSPSGPALKEGAASCFRCQEDFGIFRWAYNCMQCGEATCADCLQIRRLPDYEDPASVCKICVPKILMVNKSDWLKPLQKRHIRDIVTPTYLRVLDELGFATKPQFLQWATEFVDDRDELGFATKPQSPQWATQFVDENRCEKAIQCTISGCGGKQLPVRWHLPKMKWIELASILLQEGDWRGALCQRQPNAHDRKALEEALLPAEAWGWTERVEALLPQGDWLVLAKRFTLKTEVNCYKYAKHCLSEIPLDWQQRMELAHLFATSEPYLSVLCYLQAGYKYRDFEALALHYSGLTVGRLCLGLAANLKRQEYPTKRNYSYGESEKEESLYFSGFCQKALAQNKWDIAIAAGALANFSQSEWQNAINRMDQPAALKGMQTMNSLLEWNSKVLMYTKIKWNWEALRFRSDIDHLRCHFMDETDAASQLSRFLDIILAPGNDPMQSLAMIPALRQKVQDLNLDPHRDAFFAKGDYNRALICHRLSRDAISWEELARKWRQKDENGSLAAYLCQDKAPAKLAEEFYAAGDTSLALRCYLQTGNIATIKAKATHADYKTRLLYQLALYMRSPSDSNALFAILTTMSSEKENIPVVNELLKAALLGAHFHENTLPFHRLLLKMGMSDKELLGLLSFTSTLQLNSTNQAWYDMTLAGFQAKFSSELQHALSQISLKEVWALVDLFDELTLEPIHMVLEKLKIDQMERSPHKAVCLMARAMAQLFSSNFNGCLSAMNDLTEAVLCDPSPDCMEFYARALEKIASYTEIDSSSGKAWKMRGKQMTNLHATTDSEFKNSLARTPDLKMILRAEEAIAKFSPLQAALSQIDLSMGIPFGVGMVGAFLQAALSLSQALKNETHQTNQPYAYNRAIVELVQIAYTLGNAQLCPPTQLYVLRAGIAIMTSSFKSCRHISQDDQMLLEAFSEEAERLAKVTPTMLTRLISIYDLLYVDLINRKLTAVYLNRMCQTSSKPVYQYYLLEGAWKGWLDEEKHSFDELREKTMYALLEEKGQSIEQVERLMHSPALPRDDDGWLLKQTSPLNLSPNAFSSVKGIRFNKETGEISMLLESSASPMDALFDMNDVSEMMQRGITGAEFTLDPPSQEMTYHPFQEMLYAPKALANTGFLDTMLQADLVMKWLSTGTETNSQAPFAIRDGEHMLKRLPLFLQKKFKKLSNKGSGVADRVHRFWIQAEKLFYQQNETDTETTFTFGPCGMSVQKKRMIRKHDGSLVDDELDEETDSQEAKFARLMTKYYPILEKHFPVFARLREFGKLQAMSNIAQSVYAGAKKRSAEFNIPSASIIQKLEKLRSQISHPNHPQIKKEVATILQEIHHTNYDHTLHYVNGWLDHGAEYDLVKHLKAGAENHIREQILRVCQTMEKSGIASKLSEEFGDSACTWVPATFHKKNRQRVYGGVRMLPTLVHLRAANDANFQPAKGGPIYRFEHVIRCDSGGRIYGTTACVDPISGNTYREQHHFKSEVFDQWRRYNTDIQAFWRSTLNPKIDHYMKHYSSDCSHTHYTQQHASCVDKHGKRTDYDPKRHRHGRNGSNR